MIPHKINIALKLKITIQYKNMFILSPELLSISIPASNVWKSVNYVIAYPTFLYPVDVNIIVPFISEH
jgi:hypothetical protein